MLSDTRDYEPQLRLGSFLDGALHRATKWLPKWLGCEPRLIVQPSHRVLRGGASIHGGRVGTTKALSRHESSRGRRPATLSTTRPPWMIQGPNIHTNTPAIYAPLLNMDNFFLRELTVEGGRGKRPHRPKRITGEVPAAFALSASSIAPLTAWLASGAGRMPSCLAKSTPASKHSVCLYATAWFSVES